MGITSARPRAGRTVRTLLVAGALLALALAPPVQAEGTRRALLIGISEYGPGGFSDLPGPANDVPLLREVLTTRLGVDPADMIVLTDAEATHSGVQRAFERLAELAGPEDLVYVHYSGHGSFTDDLDGDERSGRDQTWVTFGARAEGDDLDAYDVLDDELRTWIDRLAARAGRVVVVSDSCHSGTVTRGAVLATRRLPGDERPHPLGRASFTTRAAGDGVIRIGAARDDQLAAEVRAPDANPYGLFTWHWAAALASAAPGSTWGEVFDVAAARVVAERGDFQVPQFSGERGAPAIPGSAANAARVPVLAVDGASVTLATGMLSGATEGSVYAPEGAGEAGTRIELVSVSPTSARGRVTGPVPTVGDLVTEIEHRYAGAPLRAHVVDAGADDAALLAAVRARVAGLDGWEAAPEAAAADFVVALTRPPRTGDFDTGSPLPAPVPAAPPEAWVLTPAGELRHRAMRSPLADADAGLDALAANLERVARARAVRLLGRESAGAAVELVPLVYEADEGCAEPDPCLRLDGLGTFFVAGAERPDRLRDRGLRRGDLVTFRIENRSPGDRWVYLLNVAPDATIAPLFPAPGSPADAARLAPGEGIDLFEAGYAVLLEERGQELIKAVVTQSPVPIHLLGQSGFRGGPGDPLQQLLAGALTGTRTVVRLRRDTWSTVDLAFDVR